MTQSALAASDANAARNASGTARFAVVVLGDLGRSPRIGAHALSLAQALGTVDLVGEGGTPLPPWLLHSRLHVHTLPARSEGRAGRGRVLGAALAMTRQAWALLRTLLSLPRPRAILVQTPPALPTLPVVWLFSKWTGARLILDWHNLGHSLLELSLPPTHPAVRVTKWTEGFFARRVAVALAVSDELAEALSHRFGARRVTVFEDRPLGSAAPRSDGSGTSSSRRVWVAAWGSAERAAELSRLVPEAGREPRPLVVLCPSSFTSDEDHGLLAATAPLVERALATAGAPSRLQLLVLATGRGPRRAHWEAVFSRLAQARIAVRTVWLEAVDYARLLACADLGLCLHRSASGLDLPYKLVEFEGAGLPALVLDDGSAVSRRVSETRGQRAFTGATSLGESLAQMALEHTRGAPSSQALARLRSAATTASRPGWADEWARVVQPLFSSRSDSGEVKS